MPEDIITRILSIPQQIIIFWRKVLFYGNETVLHFKKHWKKYVALAVVVYLIIHKDVSIDLQLTGSPETEASTSLLGGLRESFFFRTSNENDRGGSRRSAFDEGAQPRNVSQVESENQQKSWLASFLSRIWSFGENDEIQGDNFSDSFLTESETGVSEAARRRAEKIRKQKEYVKKYAGVARREMEEFGIPASITLAQGLLESDAGQSSLSVKNNNHFGIKCFSRRCRKGHCSNYSDDHHKDFFRIYKTPEESYRAHSVFLQGKRYRSLFKLKSYDYEGWAYGLKEAGYATDKNYAEKLVNIIEELELHRYDR